MIGIHDPAGVEKNILHEFVDFNGKDIFEVGCGDGRMTWLYADPAASILAFDPDGEAISEARKQMPEHLGDKVEFRVADSSDVELEDAAYDVGVLAWSI